MKTKECVEIRITVPVCMEDVAPVAATRVEVSRIHHDKRVMMSRIMQALESRMETFIGHDGYPKKVDSPNSAIQWMLDRVIEQLVEQVPPP